ncbi:hypothetical protein HPB47_005593 [Ixodes persulcatus]|uniref:Uncharacterized protein n=1 Tax=Ixodes persulcatus TaxID=34615 RepID=A0AC60PCF6_IXOPE|nr:hypothetical protein HPB47_005593 [Ixodes persulcatus]
MISEAIALTQALTHVKPLLLALWCKAVKLEEHALLEQIRTPETGARAEVAPRAQTGALSRTREVVAAGEPLLPSQRGGSSTAKCPAVHLGPRTGEALIPEPWTAPEVQ